MMEFFDKVKAKFSKGVTTIEEGSKKLVGKAKIYNDIHNVEVDKEKLIKLLGSKVYDMYTKKEEISESLKSFCEEIEKRDASLEELRQKLNDIDCPKS
ncbi:MAG: hypothetical protein IKZ35_01960 [Clostridia bacterium]|nr:hypothetical protein [Clostridia bacterium]